MDQFQQQKGITGGIWSPTLSIKALLSQWDAYLKIGDANFKGALWTFVTQLVSKKFKCVVLFFSNRITIKCPSIRLILMSHCDHNIAVYMKQNKNVEHHHYDSL